MLSICLFFKTSELKYAYKLHAYKKKMNVAKDNWNKLG